MHPTHNQLQTNTQSATDRIIAGLESHKLISPEEKRIVAYHEAGHAVAGAYCCVVWCGCICPCLLD